MAGTPTTPTTSQYQGISTPPPDNTITVNPNDNGDVAIPNSNDSTISQSAAPDQPAQDSPGQDTAQAKAGAAAQGAPQATPQGQPTDQSQGQGASQQPDLSKAPSPTIPGAPALPQQNPAIKKAGVFHDIAETLAGGPRYRYDIDAYGNTKQTKVPVSNAHLALAIAMEALSGAAIGASQVGPGSEGRAGAMAFQQSQQQVQQDDQQQRQRAQEDFSRRAQVTETNMRMYAVARNIGRQDEEATDKYIAQYAGMAKQLQEQFPGYVKGIVPYSDFAKYNVTSENAIPFSRVPRIDKNPDSPNYGKQVMSNGVPQWDVDYMIVDPSFKASGLLNDEDMKNFKEMGMPWADNGMIGDTPLNGVMALNKKAQSTQWTTAKQNFNDFFDTLDEASKPAEGGAAAPTGDLLTPGTLQAPTLKNKAVDNFVDAAAKKYAYQVQDIISPENFTSVLKAIVNQESGSNTQAVSSKGARGPMQLMPGTAASLGVKNIDDPKENIDGGAKLFTQLLIRYKSLPLALAAYNASPGAVDKAKGNVPNIPETQDYVKSITSALGFDAAAPATQETPAAQHPDLAEFTKTHKTMPSAVEQFNASLAHTDGSFAAALKDMESKGQSGADNAALIASFLGGASAIKTHDDYIAAQAEARKENTKNATKLSYDAAKKKAEEEGIIARNATLIDALANGKNIDLSRIATMRAYDREIITNEVMKRNPDYNPASIDRAIKLSEEAADESKTGSIGNSIANVNTAYGHMGEAVEHITNMQNRLGRDFSDYTNKPMSWMNDHFGNDPEYQQWKVALQAAATDWQNLLNNQHALTETDKNVAKTVADPNATFGNAIASLREMARTGAVRTIPLNERWKQTMGVNHPNLIQPQTVEALKKINDPVTNNYLKDLESGGSLAGGEKGVGSQGKRLGDILGVQKAAPKPMKANMPSQYQKISKDGKIGADASGNKYVIATGLPVQQ